MGNNKLSYFSKQKLFSVELLSLLVNWGKIVAKCKTHSSQILIAILYLKLFRENIV